MCDNIRKLEIKSIHYRKNLLKYIKQANAGHTGGSLSCIDILNVLYNRILNVTPDKFQDPDRDRYIQSKGHSVEALYVVLADRGFFPLNELDTLGRYLSHYIGHPTRKVKGIEQNTGALGHGLSVAVGIALAGKLDHKNYKVFTLLGDGELTEGSNWEAALTASHYRLDNLVAIVDYNRLQITDLTSKVCNTDPLDEKFSSFGWQVERISGHDIQELTESFSKIPISKDCPTCFIAETKKGKGISFMENEKKWHHGVPNDEQYREAREELDKMLIELSMEDEE